MKHFSEINIIFLLLTIIFWKRSILRVWKGYAAEYASETIS